MALKDSYFSYGVDVPLERVTKSTPGITTDHAYIHEGLAYTMTGTFAAATTVAAIGIKAPAAAKASKTVVMTDTNANLLYTFNTEGKRGNDWSVVHVDPSDTTQAHALKVSVSGTVITVSLAAAITTGTITSTAAQVAEAVNASDAGEFVTVTVPGSGGTVNAVASQTLAGGAHNVYLHFKPTVIQSAIDITTARFMEAATFTGAAVSPMWTAVNQNRITTKTSEVTITSSAAATVDATATAYKLLWTKTARGSASGQGKFQGTAGSPEEIVLKPGVQYVMDFTKAGSTAIDFELFWYEEASA